MSNNNYSIKITPKADEDLEKIYSYISRELFSKQAVESLLDKIEEKIMRLREFPFLCNYVDDEFLGNQRYRKLIIDNYIVFYLADTQKEQVIIMRVLYGRQKYEGLL